MCGYVPRLGVHEETVFDGGGICCEEFKEGDSGADVGGIWVGEELEVGVIAVSVVCFYLVVVEIREI